ncbi:MAG: hypothetical protein K2H19_02200 [Ruminococcus sp.]|nr:hypothetical protein [Ruminococcus sp.]
MKKQNIYRAYCATFIGICLIPAVCMPFFKSDSSAEKRALSEFPSITTEENKINFDFFDEFDTWFSEHFAFRQELVNADGRIKSTLMGTSPNSDVIVGKNGWLYYGETTDDYLNINTLSIREINNIVHNLHMINDYCEQNNAEFLFFSAPNKNSVYPENMPFNYIPTNKDGNYELLSAELSDDEFYLDMKSVILLADSSIPLYHKTDTHWNNLGAYAGHSAIMAKLGREICSAGTNWYTKNDRLGDLAEMIYPAEKAKDMQVYNDYQFSYTYQGIFRSLDELTINTFNENSDGNLLMFRDSYGEAILPYMAECFNTAEFSRIVPYRLNNISGKTVILEIVERNLGDLQKYAPVMNAPIADISDISSEFSDDEIIIKTEKNGGFIHIYGILPDDAFSGESHNIYIESGSIAYEAFNCFEDKLLEREGERSANGFSLYIPTENSIDNIRVTVVNSDGKAVTYKD